jgi:WD40 repeat protein
MTTVREWHTATLLPDGRVLVTGGDDTFNVYSTAELYDPAKGTWTATGSLGHARRAHTANLLPDGKVLAVGGQDASSTTTASSELYDPITGTWTATGPLGAARDVHTATLLPNGKVLVAAGFSFNPDTWFSSAELYDSAPGPITLVNLVKRPGGAFQFAFTGAANGTNTILATTNTALSLSNWTVLGLVPEFSPGLYLFSDPQAANNPQRFYCVRSP